MLLAMGGMRRLLQQVQQKVGFLLDISRTTMVRTGSGGSDNTVRRPHGLLERGIRPDHNQKGVAAKPIHLRNVEVLFHGGNNDGNSACRCDDNAVRIINCVVKVSIRLVREGGVRPGRRGW